jgi:DNA-directed RNA polymerase omega subunit
MKDRTSMKISNEVPTNQFACVTVASRRARQLMSGALPLIAYPRSHQPSRIAMEELNARLLEYQMPEDPENTAGEDGKRDKT